MRVVLRAMALIGAATLLACSGDDGDGAAAGGGSGGSGGDRGSGESVTKLRIDGPLWVLEGETAVLRAIAFFPDGSTRDVSNEAEWSWTDDEANLDIDGGVIVTGPGDITSDVRIAYGGLTYEEPFFIFRRQSGGPPINFEDRNTIGIIEMDGAGDTKQLRATCRMPDRRVIDVSDKGTWESSNPNAISVSDTGLATANVDQAATEMWIRWRERFGSNVVQVGEPLPDTFRITVSGVRIRVDFSCDSATNLDGGDGEFVFEITAIVSDGSRYPIQATNNYPSRDGVIEIDQNDSYNLTGEATFELLEYQNFQVELRITEWDREFTDIGDPIPDGAMDDEVRQNTHFNDNFFDAGGQSLPVNTNSADCQVRLDYSISAQRL